MKKNSIVFLLLVSVGSFSPDLSGITANMKSFNWLQGSWQMQTRRGIITEKWAVANDSTLAGESMMIRADGTEIPLEKIELAFRNGNYYYIPTVKNQNGEQPVEFKIISHNETGFVAENPQHDFPKRISYTLVNRDSIHAVIDDGAVIPVKKSNFLLLTKKRLTMSSFDWSRFIVRINIRNATTQQLYRAWATRTGIEYWFLRMSEYKKADGTVLEDDDYVQTGDNYRWRWFGYSDEVTETGEILACNGVDFFKFRFGKAGDCSIRIYQEQNEMIVELLQDNIPTDDKAKERWHIGCKTGWTFYLANLKSMYEGGIDLRNKNEQLQDMINA